MAHDHVSYRYQFGLALHESGLNKVSAGLKVSHPEYFTQQTDIPIKAGQPGTPPVPGNVLTLYVVANEPLAFELYPIAKRPDLPVDSFYVRVDVSFVLRDSLLGLVTRIGAILDAAGRIEVADIEDPPNSGHKSRGAKLSVLEFDVVELRGEHPATALRQLMSHISIGGATKIAHRRGGKKAAKDDGLGRSFDAIVRYMIALFLHDGLAKAVKEFRLPQLDQLLSFNQFGSLPVQGVYVRNDALYATVGEDLGGPEPFPDPPQRAYDLRVGVSGSGIRRIINAITPIKLPPIDVGNDNRTLGLHGQLEISKIGVGLHPSVRRIATQVYVGGVLYIHINLHIPLLNRWWRPRIPVPIDPITHYSGWFVPSVRVDDEHTSPTPDNPKVHLMIRPAKNFFEEWYALIITDYRTLFEHLFRKAVQDARDDLLGKKFCKIPLLGWLVCGVLDVTADVLGYLTGAALDAAVSAFLTVVANTVGRAILTLFVDDEFDVWKIEQKKLRDKLGVTLLQAEFAVLDDGREGELVVSGFFDDQGLPTPPLPDPVQVPQLPVPIDPPSPFDPQLTLPEPTPGDFRPVISWPKPAWTDGEIQSYEVNATTEHGVIVANANVSYELAAGIWTVRLEVSNQANGAPLASATAEYDAATFEPRRSEFATIFNGKTARQIIDYTADANGRRVLASIGTDGEPSLSQNTLLHVGVPRDFEELWMFKIAHAVQSMSTRLAGHFARIELSDASQYVNWSRELPVHIAVSNSTAIDPDKPLDPPIKVWLINSVDEERTTQLKVAKDGRGLFEAESITVDRRASTTFKRKPRP